MSETIQYKGFTITIKQDELAESPRAESEPASTMVCEHSRPIASIQKTLTAIMSTVAAAFMGTTTALKTPRGQSMPISVATHISSNPFQYELDLHIGDVG